METTETNFEDGKNFDSDQFGMLSEMSGQFDPEEAKKQVGEAKKKIEEEKQSVDLDKHIKIVSPATRIVTDENGHSVIESKYIDAYYAYEKSDDYDRRNPEDVRLGRAFWNVGFASAMLDCNKDFREQLENNNVDEENLAPDAARQFKKAFNGLLEIADSTDSSKVNELMKQMENAGPIGEYFSGLFDAICELKANGMELTPHKIPFSKNGHSDDLERENADPMFGKELGNEAANDLYVKFDALEQEYANLMSGKGISIEAVDDLYAKYSELSKTVSDPKVLEKVTERRNSLFSLNNKLEEINKEISGIDS